MKKENVLIVLLILLVITMFFSANCIDKQSAKIKKLESEAEKTFSIDEAMFIYKEGHRKGALRITGNYLNFQKMYNPNEFEIDSLYYRRTLEKSLK